MTCTPMTADQAKALELYLTLQRDAADYLTEIQDASITVATLQDLQGMLERHNGIPDPLRGIGLQIVENRLAKGCVR